MPHYYKVQIRCNYFKCEYIIKLKCDFQYSCKDAVWRLRRQRKVIIKLYTSEPIILRSVNMTNV